jgi:hypothetical protein
MKKLTLLIAAFAVFGLVAGCAHYGVAKFPAKDDMFITGLSEWDLTEIEVAKTGQLETSYQILALLHTERASCAPCGAGLEKVYRELETSMQKDLIDQAKKVGADGIIQFRWDVSMVQNNPIIVVTLKGIAVKVCKKGPSCK